MDQRTVESLLRRLVERVEESERRYGEALDELHARLDQLSQTTEAARDTGATEDSDTFDRLQTQVSKLAQRFEQDASTSLEDFERLGRALSGGVRHDIHDIEDSSTQPLGPEPSPFAQAVMAGGEPAEPAPQPTLQSSFSEYEYDTPEPSHSLPQGETEDFGREHADLDKRLVEMAQRLEQSIGSAMPTGALEALNTRLDEIGGQLSRTLESASSREALEHVERQLSDMSQQVSRAEEQLGKVSGIEDHLLKLIERLDEKAAAPAPQTDPAQLEEVANKAATEAARQVADEAKKGTERLDAMHRDITAMSDKSRESSDRLVSTLEAVHESLKQLVQQVERGAPAFQPKARAPFLEQARQAGAKPAQPQAKGPVPQPQPATPQAEKAAAPIPTQNGNGEKAEHPPKETLRDRLGASIPDFKESETPPPFGRANLVREEEAVDLDAGRGEQPAAPRPQPRETDTAKEGKAPEDLVAAARRAAQAAAMRAEERSGRRSSSYLAGSASSEQPGRRKRSVLIIAAAVLLVLSALLLYGRLQSKPETEVPASSEQTAPTPADGSEGAADTGAEGAAPGPEESAPADPDQSGWAPVPDTDIAPPANVGQATTGFTEMAKSSPRMPESELAPDPQPASVKPMEAEMPPGVVFSIEEPADGSDATIDGQSARAVPADLPMPPEDLGPLSLRKAAADGDAKAQYVIATRYANGKGAKRDLKKAATWLKRAASAGLAPAQYRLAAMYERGIGVDEDLGRARTWYEAAAKKGNVKAMHNLAVSVSGRNGGTPDYERAAKWYGEAAAHGLADSQFNLGILAEHGLGMKKDLAEAYKWFALAATHGDSEAAKRREIIRVHLAPETLAEAEAAVKAWTAKQTAAEANEVAEAPAWVAAKAPASEGNSLVTRAQTLLNKLGYDVGPPDGIVGSRTRGAVKLFQQRNGLEETGEVSAPLVTKLEHLTG